MDPDPCGIARCDSRYSQTKLYFLQQLATGTLSKQLVIHSHTTLFKLLSFLFQSLRVIYSFLGSYINILTSGMN